MNPSPRQKEEFDRFREETRTIEGWIEYYKDNGITVQLKEMDSTNVVRVRTQAHFPDVSPKLMYSALIHHEYVRSYDKNMSSWETKSINNSNDISYYASTLPSWVSWVISPRDFLSHRSFGKTGENEFMIIMSSVEHDSFPKQKGFVRAHIHITGFLCEPHPDGGCFLTYLSQTDLKGKIPIRIINWCTKSYGPKIVKKFRIDALAMVEWQQTEMKTKPVAIYDAITGELVEEEED